MDQVIITAALTGAVTPKAKNAHIPITPEEIAADAYACWKAGAAMVHLHMRADDGLGAMDKEKFRETIRLIRSHQDCDVIINCTSSGASAEHPATDEERMAHHQELEGIEMGSYDAGTFNWMPGGVFMNSPQFLEKLGDLYLERGIKPEVEIFDAGIACSPSAGERHLVGLWRGEEPPAHPVCGPGPGRTYPGGARGQCIPQQGSARHQCPTGGTGRSSGAHLRKAARYPRSGQRNPGPEAVEITEGEDHMKVVRLADAFGDPVTGHFDMRALRLHNKETSNTVDYTLGLSHFLPGGGTEYVETGVELIYFILEGEMTVRTKDETIVLKKYDSIHFNVGDGKEIRNETNLPASMLVIAGMPGRG